MIHSLHLDSFYLTEEQLENSPSRQDGIDKDTEANLRMYGCEIIQEAGLMLSFDQVVMATGQVLLHRFYCKRSMKTFNVKVGAALLLVLLTGPPAFMLEVHGCISGIFSPSTGHTSSHNMCWHVCPAESVCDCPVGGCQA
jgi:hypothetical protein